MLAVERLGRQNYQAAWNRQVAVLEARIRGEVPDTLIIVEHAAPCTEVQSQVKGPDPAGRIDFKPSSPCEETVAPQTTEFVPTATRYVFTHRINAFPASGISLWIDKGEAPLLRVAPVRTTGPSRDPG